MAGAVGKKAKVTSGSDSAVVVDALTDAVASITESATTQQDNFDRLSAGFDNLVISNDKTLEALNILAETMEVFARDGKIGNGGQTGGAASFGVTSSEKTRGVVQEVVSKELGNATNTIVDEVRSEGSRTRERVKESAEKTQSEIARDIKRGFQEQRSEMDLISSFIKRMSGKGDVSSKIDSVGDIIDKFTDGPGAAKLIGKMKNVAGALGLATTVGTVFADAVGEGKQLIYSADQTSLNQTGEKGNYGITLGMDLDKQALAYSTGMSQSSVQAIQSSLIRYGADYNSDEYREGMNFAINAQTEYGVDSKTATDLYTKTVLRGNMALSDLNDAMESLNETVQNTGISMQEAVEDLQDSIRSFSSFAGSDTLASEYGVDLEQYSGDSDLASYGGVSAISAIAADYSSDAQTNEKASEYESQGYSTATASSMAAISTALNEGRATNSKNQDILTMPLGDGEDKRTLIDYWADEDWDALAEAVDNPNKYFAYQGGGSAKNTVIKKITSVFHAEHLDDGNSVASFFKGLKSTMGSIADQSGNDMGEEAAEALTEVGYTVSNITGDAIDNSSLIKSALGSYKGADGASADDVYSDSSLYEDIMKSTGSQMSGYLSNDVLSTMSTKQSQAYAQKVYEEFLNEDDETKSKGLQAYIESDHGRDEITEIANSYSQSNREGEASEASKQQVLVEIGFKDGADDILYSKWKKSSNEENRTNGTGS